MVEQKMPMINEYKKKEYDYVSKDYNKNKDLIQVVISRHPSKQCVVCKVEMECNLINFGKCSVVVKDEIKKIYLRSECRKCWCEKNKSKNIKKPKIEQTRAANRKYYHKNKNTEKARWRKSKNVIHRRLQRMFAKRHLMNPSLYFEKN